MWERACVGAGLPAIAMYQALMCKLTRRYRGQARSHIDLFLHFDRGQTCAGKR